VAITALTWGDPLANDLAVAMATRKGRRGRVKWVKQGIKYMPVASRNIIWSNASAVDLSLVSHSQSPPRPQLGAWECDRGTHTTGD